MSKSNYWERRIQQQTDLLFDKTLLDTEKELKKKYGDIAIRGIAYEYETIQEATFGPFFYCTENDTELTVTFEWQECANCGEIVETDVV